MSTVSQATDKTGGGPQDGLPTYGLNRADRINRRHSVREGRFVKQRTVAHARQGSQTELGSGCAFV